MLGILESFGRFAVRPSEEQGNGKCILHDMTLKHDPSKAVSTIPKLNTNQLKIHKIACTSVDRV